jgi:protocatechuate 3,4-dioxygenase beta subunit
MVLLLTLLLFQSNQTQQPPQTASIEGVVVRFGTVDAVPRARVVLSPVEGSASAQAATADGDGRFSFRNLAPGNYRLNATRDGYVPAEYGQRSPSSAGLPLSVAAQQQLRDVRIGMTQSGTIAGRILNRYGEPAANVNVQALRYTYQEGRRILTPVQTMRTNDLGEYRLFWLPPGQYIVGAQGSDAVPTADGGTLMIVGGAGRGAAPSLGAGGITQIMVTRGAGPPGPGAIGGPMPNMPPPPPPPLLRGAESAEVSLPVYFSGTTDASKAIAIDLRPGATFGGADMTIMEARAIRIRGQVFSGGQPARGASVAIYARGSAVAGFTIRTITVSDTGTFEFRGVAPGSYELVASLNAAAPGAFIGGTPLGNAAGISPTVTINAAGPRMAARATVDVHVSDIEGISLSLDSGFNVAGRVSIEGRAPSENDPALAGVRIQLLPDPNIPPLGIPAVGLGSNGMFSIAGVTPGDYRLSATLLGRNTYVKSARLGSVDMLNGGLRLDSDPRGALEVVLGTTPGALDVTVLDDRRMPVPAVTVALVPDSSQRKRYEVYRNATTDSSGQVRLEGVVPGDYRLYAWEDVENGAWLDPDFMRNYESRGTSVRVADGARAAAEVRVIPYKIN